MKTFFHALIGFLRFLVIAAAGAGLMAVALGGPWCPEDDCWGWFLDALRPLRMPALAVGGGLLILELLHRLTRPRTRRSPESMTFTSKAGPVISVKTAAVRDVIARVAEEFDSVVEMKTAVTHSRGQVDLDLTVRAVAGTPIPALCNKLQNRAREVVSQQIGLFELRQVRVHLQELLPPATGGASTWAPAPAPDLSDASDLSDSADAADAEAPTRAREAPPP